MSAPSLVAEGRKPALALPARHRCGDRLGRPGARRQPHRLQRRCPIPILIREDGSYLYTLPSVVDDIDLGVSHVIRGEDHVTNTAVQVQLFADLGRHACRHFGHHNLLDDGEWRRPVETLRRPVDRWSPGRPGSRRLAVASLAVLTGSSDAVQPDRQPRCPRARSSSSPISRAIPPASTPPSSGYAVRPDAARPAASRPSVEGGLAARRDRRRSWPNRSGLRCAATSPRSSDVHRTGGRVVRRTARTLRPTMPAFLADGGEALLPEEPWDGSGLVRVDRARSRLEDGAQGQGVVPSSAACA